MKYNYLTVIPAVLLIGATDKSVNALQLRSKGSVQMTSQDEDVGIANIYGIPSESETLQIKNKKDAKKKSQTLAQKKTDLKKAFSDFSKNFKEETFDKGMKLKQELIDLDVPKDELDKTKINTSQIFKKQFSFPEVAKNDFASDLLEQLEIQEKNFNQDLENVDLYNNFVETADEIKKKLQDKYGDQWTDPALGEAPKDEEE